MADYEMYAGDDFLLVEAVTDENGAAKNITGFHMWFTAKKTLAHPDEMAVARLDNGSLGGITFLTPLSQGKAKIVMPKLATRWTYTGPVVLYFSVKVQDTEGLETTIEAGTILVKPNPTRAV